MLSTFTLPQKPTNYAKARYQQYIESRGLLVDVIIGIIPQNHTVNFTLNHESSIASHDDVDGGVQVCEKKTPCI